MHICYWWESQKEREEDQDIGQLIILGWILEIRWSDMDWNGLAQEGSCEHGNKPLGSIKCWEVLEWLQNW
jgi:hypothetical protein